VPSLDFEAVRHRVKLIEDSGDTRIFENRDGVPCPVCGDPFEEALATGEATHQLGRMPQHRFCLVREEDTMVILTHATEG
jgi:hypothetical protein